MNKIIHRLNNRYLELRAREEEGLESAEKIWLLIGSLVIAGIVIAGVTTFVNGQMGKLPG